MSLGLPGHLAPHSESRAFARASHVISFVILIADILLVLSLQSADADRILWPAAVAILPILVVLWLLERYRSWFYSLTYLIVGTASLYWLVLAGTSQFPAQSTTDSLFFTLPKIALILVGGAGIGARKAIGWSVLGYVLGESAAILAGLQTGAAIEFDVTAFGVLVVSTLLFTVIGVSRKAFRRVCDKHRAVSVAHARAAGQESVFIENVGQSVNGDSCDIQLSPRGALVQGLDILENVLESIAVLVDLVGRHGVKHESVIGIGRVAQG